MASGLPPAPVERVFFNLKRHTQPQQSTLQDHIEVGAMLEGGLDHFPPKFAHFFFVPVLTPPPPPPPLSSVQIIIIPACCLLCVL